MSATAKLKVRGQWQQDEDGTESVVDTYEVLASSETETIATILGASGIPADRSSHPERAAAICVTRDATPDPELLTVWTVNCRFTTKPNTYENDNYNLQKVKGGVQSGSIEVPAFHDARGYPLVNSAGDLYEGLTRKVRTRVFNVTANLTAIPDYLLNLSDTINDSAVTILGVSYPAGSCLLTDVNCPDEPTRDKAGNKYYPVTYKITYNPLGWYILLPNKGPNELVYQTRTSSTANWQDVTKATYDGKTPTTDRRIIKRPIESDEQQPLGDIWLDANGQAQKVVTLATTQLGTANMTAGSTTLTLATGSLDSTKHVGALVRVIGAGPRGAVLQARIASIASSTSATLAIPARTTVTGAIIWMSGVIVNQFIMEDLASWSSLPLPNNQP